MTIKEVSEKFDITADTLRYYERVGLIPPVARNASGNRDYQEKDVDWVEHTVSRWEMLHLARGWISLRSSMRNLRSRENRSKPPWIDYITRYQNMRRP